MKPDPPQIPNTSSTPPFPRSLYEITAAYSSGEMSDAERKNALKEATAILSFIEKPFNLRKQGDYIKNKIIESSYEPVNLFEKSLQEDIKVLFVKNTEPAVTGTIAEMMAEDLPVDSPFVQLIKEFRTVEKSVAILESSLSKKLKERLEEKRAARQNEPSSESPNPTDSPSSPRPR